MARYLFDPTALTDTTGGSPILFVTLAGLEPEPIVCTLQDFLADNADELDEEDVLLLRKGRIASFGGGAAPEVVVTPFTLEVAVELRESLPNDGLDLALDEAAATGPDAALALLQDERSRRLALARADELTRDLTAFQSFQALLDAPGGYRPSIWTKRRTGGETPGRKKDLADLYDQAQEARGDVRRAFRGW